MVVDKENIDNLVEFSQFAIDKGWTKSPYFKTQIGRNYELHFCNSTPDKLFDRATLYKKIYEFIIERAKNRSLNCYVEKHHIIPKCLGGLNNKDNIIKLTAKEHFICHRLLVE
jgi:hypothetical protein